MKHIYTCVVAILCVFACNATRFVYNFNKTNLASALTTIAEQHPEIQLNFIYNEIDNYTTTASIDTDNAYQALRQTIGLNPVLIISDDGHYYIEALQHGKYRYYGDVVDDNNEPVVGASVMLLTPRDSVVITYGVTDMNGRFSIPCDKRNVIVKLTCVGYKATYVDNPPFAVGTVTMQESPIQLSAVTVEADNAILSADKSTYIPSARQKNASQSGTDLLNRMAIPQLAPSMGTAVMTTAGKPVDIFIDYLPASEQDLTGMRIEDVKKVDYYDFPKDPRFQGKDHVINFIMRKYEYGGYIKARANEIFYANASNLNLYSKVQYKRMTYDLAVGGHYRYGSHDYNNTVETYRLPQPDGSIKQFERYSETKDAEINRRYFWPTFKALYSTDKITISNAIGANFDKYPKDNTSGTVYFSPADYPQTDFVSEANHSENYVTYNGNWNFILPHGNVINFVPYYSYAHSEQNSRYVESGTQEYINAASDNTQWVTGDLRFQHNFGKWGDLTVFAEGSYTDSKTNYEGTASATERLTALCISPGISYSYSSDKLYGKVGVGFTYHSLELGGGITDKNTQPRVDFSLQYAFNKKNSINSEFHYVSLFPALPYRSTAVIQSNPLMSYTGNPNLTSNQFYDIGLSYQWIPNNIFSLSVFGTGYITNNRFVYVYEASPDGILRTVQQSMGEYVTGRYGLRGSARLLNNNLQISGMISHYIVDNGEPFNWKKSNIYGYIQAFYYLNDWHFGVQYQSAMASSNGFVEGVWWTSKDAYTAIVGWGNSSWNLQAQFGNFFRWNWRNGTAVMTSQNYDFVKTSYDSNYHFFINVKATYTFGFGKKIKVDNEASKMSGAGNSILK